MAEAAHLFGVVAGQHVGEVAAAEAHLRAEGGGEELPRDLGHIDGGGRLEAIVAIAASLRRVFAEVSKQDGAPAAGRLDQCGERIEALALRRAALGLDLLLYPLAGTGKVLRSPEQPGFGRFAVAPGAARLLVIGLDALWDGGVGDQPDVGLVD